jgi:hypothetical protein
LFAIFFVAAADHNNTHSFIIFRCTHMTAAVIGAYANFLWLKMCYCVWKNDSFEMLMGEQFFFSLKNL